MPDKETYPQRQRKRKPRNPRPDNQRLSAARGQTTTGGRISWTSRCSTTTRTCPTRLEEDFELRGAVQVPRRRGAQAGSHRR